MNGQIQIETDSVWNPYASHENELEQLHRQLAAAQAREVQLRGALAYYANGSHGKLNTAAKALAQPSDTSALDAMIQKAGEVAVTGAMQACADLGAKGIDYFNYARFITAIRKLPPITLEDLQK